MDKLNLLPAQQGKSSLGWVSELSELHFSSALGLRHFPSFLPLRCHSSQKSLSTIFSHHLTKFTNFTWPNSALAQYISLLLGLPLLSLPTPDGLCNCRAPLSAFGYHQHNCSKWLGGSGRSWKRGHDIVVKALAFEILWLGMGAVDLDFTMIKNDIAHPASQKQRGFCCHFWQTPSNHQCCGVSADWHQSSDFIIDVLTCGDWRWEMNGQMECWHHCA